MNSYHFINIDNHSISTNNIHGFVPHHYQNLIFNQSIRSRHTSVSDHDYRTVQREESITGLSNEVQGDQLYMTVYSWYPVKKYLSSVLDKLLIRRY